MWGGDLLLGSRPGDPHGTAGERRVAVASPRFLKQLSVICVFLDFNPFVDHEEGGRCGLNLFPFPFLFDRPGWTSVPRMALHGP